MLLWYHINNNNPPHTPKKMLKIFFQISIWYNISPKFRNHRKIINKSILNKYIWNILELKFDVKCKTGIFENIIDVWIPEL